MSPKKINRIDPLGYAEIVEQDRKPTPFFARQWQNLTNLVKSVVALDEEAKSAAQRIAANEEAIDDISAREVIAGDVLDGGGFLGGPGDIEIDHAQSGVTPGQYGDDTHVAQIDVDAFGHITDVTEVPISGGGGGGGGLQSFALGFNGSDSGSSFATKGIGFTPQVNVTISRISAKFSQTNGATYRAYLMELNGSDEILSIVESSDFVSSGGSSVKFFDIAPTNISAGGRYAAMIGRRDGGDTFSLPIVFSNQTFANFPSDGPMQVSAIAQAIPAVGQTVNYKFNFDSFGIGMHWDFT